MKSSLFFAAILASVFMFSCKKNNSNSGSSNLIANPSFEMNGDTTFQGWSGGNYSFVSDTPPGGGQWALQLMPEWFPGEGHADYTITNLAGNYHFYLYCYAKAPNWHGTIGLNVKHLDGTIVNLGNTPFSNVGWSVISFDATTTLDSTDQLIVHLSSGGTEIVTGTVTLDNVILQAH